MLKSLEEAIEHERELVSNLAEFGHQVDTSNLSSNALRQWEWYARGHWPCRYSEDDDLGGGEGAWPDLPALVPHAVAAHAFRLKKGTSLRRE